MRRFLIITLWQCLAVAAWCQTAEQKAIAIKSNTAEYIYGDGFGGNYAEADKNAMSDMISKIAVSLNSSFEGITTEVNTNGEIDSRSKVRMVVDTYTQGTLTNAQNLMIGTEPEYHVMRYMRKSELDKVFEMRKDKVFDLIRSAQKAEQRLKIGDALRNYYWSFALLKSLQYPNDVTIDIGGESRRLMVLIPEQINELLGMLNVRVTEVDGNNATLFFTYDGKPVGNLDFTFYNGNGWTMLNSVKNGVASIELRPNVDVRTLRIKYEYEYLGESMSDPEIESVIRVFKNNTFRHAETALSEIPANVKSLVSKAGQKEQKAFADTVGSISIATLKSPKDYQASIGSIVAAVKKNDYVSVKPLFTDEGWEMMDKLLHYGRARILGSQSFKFHELGDGRVVCRSLVMSFSFPNNNRQFTEDVTFTFNADRKIECVAFGLGAEAKADIFDRGKRAKWNDASTLAVVEFLENYKTAFALKRLDYIRSIFDDNAVIIVGHVAKRLEPKTIGEKTTYSTNEIVQYNKLSKKQYIKNLERCFASNQFVNIRFADNDVVRMGKGGETYGIQIHQDYYSSTYGDTGYLFLMVDINDPQQPTIKVRTWQPERDPNINGRLPKDNPDYGIIGPGNF